MDYVHQVFSCREAKHKMMPFGLNLDALRNLVICSQKSITVERACMLKKEKDIGFEKDQWDIEYMKILDIKLSKLPTRLMD